jgi:predicted RNA-binding Zn ribbon-like protein
MRKAISPIVGLGSATYAAQRAADIVATLQNGDRLTHQELIDKVNETLKAYGEHNDITSADLDELQIVSHRLYAVFETNGIESTATLLNEMLRDYSSVPRLSAHGNTPWHLHVDSSDHAPWAEWFAASSALALATLLTEKERNPGGLCASSTCNKPFIDLGKGGGRTYCSPRCATRERVALYRIEDRKRHQR